MSLLAVGSVAFDSIRTPRGHAERILGGSATYFTLAASYFARDVRLVAIVGDDFSDEHHRIFTQHGIGTKGLEHVAGKSFFWAGEYEANPNNRHTLATELNVFEHFSPKLPEADRDVEYLFLGNIDPALQCRVRDQMNGRLRLVGGDTMNFWIDGKPREVREFLARIDLLMINDGEALQLTEEFNLHRAARKILEMGPQAVIIKRGEHGATLYSRQGCFAAPGYPLEDVCDPTGAGDSFAGGVMGYLAAAGSTDDATLDDATLRKAVVYGSVLGSFACEQFGPGRLTELTREQIDARYQEFVRLTRFHV